MMLEAAESLHGLRVGGWHPWRFDRLKASGGFFLAVVGSHAQLHDVRADPCPCHVDFLSGAACCVRHSWKEPLSKMCTKWHEICQKNILWPSLYCTGRKQVTRSCPPEGEGKVTSFGAVFQTHQENSSFFKGNLLFGLLS